MTTDAQAVALMKEANPVPDLDSYDVSEVDLAAYLATLEQRSIEVAQLDTKEARTEESKRPVMAWLIAAMLIAVAGVAVILLSQSTEEPPVATSPTPTTVAEAVPTTIVDVVPTTEVVVVDEWEQIPTLAFAGAEGDYRTGRFAVPFSVHLPVGWISGGDEFDQVELSPTLTFCGFDPGQTEEQDALCRGMMSLTLLETATANEIVQAFTGTDGIEIESDEVEIGGMPAVSIEPLVTGDQPLVVRVDEETDFSLFPGDLIRFYLVEVGDATVIIDVFDFDDGAFYTESQPVLDSIIWKTQE